MLHAPICAWNLIKKIRCLEKIYIFYLFSLEKVKNVSVDGERKNQLYQTLHSKVMHLVIPRKCRDDIAPVFENALWWWDLWSPRLSYKSI